MSRANGAVERGPSRTGSSFNGRWGEGSTTYIAFKELFAVLLACTMWGVRWQGTRVRARCDNQAAVHAVPDRSCKESFDAPTMILFFCEAHHQVRLVAEYLLYAGVQNDLVDDLSRNWSSFLLKAPDMHKDSSPVPSSLPDLLLGVSNWTSPAWIRTFNSSLYEM